jgi:geranylgeranyl diphosphate synthase type 3
LLFIYKIYGIAQTINTTNYIYFLAYQELFALRNLPSSDPPRQRPQSIPPYPFLFFYAALPRRGIAFAPSRAGPRNSMARCPSEEDYVKDGQQQQVHPLSPPTFFSFQKPEYQVDDGL